MKGRRMLALGALLALAGATACTPLPREPRWADVRELTPAFLLARPAFDPSLAAAAGGRVALTWVTRDTAGADVWVSVSADSGGHFSPPVRLNLRRGRVTSFPESRPVVAFGPGARVVVAWAAARESVPFADDVVARASDDGGVSFGPEVTLNDDHARPASAYHGFVTLDVTPAGRAIAAWIDGRATPLAPGEREPGVAEIWSARSEDGGTTWGANARLATGVCPCCRPALRAAGRRVALAYRGVRDSLRDPRLAISSDGGATFAVDTLVAADGWRLAACPVAGPALTLAGDGGWVAWFTAAHEHAEVRAAPWDAGRGAAEAAFALDDTLREAAHPMLADMGAATAAGVLARAGGTRRVLAVRVLAGGRARSPWLLLGANARSAALAAADARHALAAWVEQSDRGPRLRLVRLTRT